MSGAVRVLTSEYYERLAALERGHWWWRGMRRIAGRLLERANLAGSSLRVLDAGCGTGLTLSWIGLATGATPVGLDRAADALRWCQSRGHRGLLQGDAVRLPFRDAAFDLVISLDVLQHLPRPGGDRSALSEFARVLAPHGVLLLRTNSRCGYTRGDDADYQRYSLAELQVLLAGAGLTCTVLSYANCLPALATTLVRQLRRRNPGGADPGLPLNVATSSITSAFGYGWLALEAAYLRFGRRSLPFGHSIVAVARKGM